MGIFDNVMNEINFLIYGTSPWIMRKATSGLDIEKCNGVASEDTETNTCALCVAVNKCIFISDANKMPLLPQHPNCRCKIEQIPPLKIEDVALDFPMEGKILKYMFFNESKKKLIEDWGYQIEDAEEVYKEILRQAKEKYVKGEYVLGFHNQYGQRITIEIILKGKRDKIGKNYINKTGWMVYPNGKLHNNTPIIGGKKWNI